MGNESSIDHATHWVTLPALKHRLNDEAMEETTNKTNEDADHTWQYQGPHVLKIWKNLTSIEILESQMLVTASRNTFSLIKCSAPDF
jgi:hypothetical protein